MESEIKKVELILRKIKTSEKILNNERRVQCISGNDIINILEKNGIKNNIIFPIMDLILDKRILVKGIINKNHVKLSLDTKFKKEDSYIWVQENYNSLNLIIGIGILLLSILLIMFQLWPAKLKSYASYTAYPFMGFLVFMILMGIIRLIVFSITFFSHPPGIWIFPNLFADVGIKDSFIPIWEYHGVDTKPKKKEE